MAATPPPKNPRKRGAPTLPAAGHDRKRAKLQDARTIAVQDTTEQALKAGELDVTAFIRSREFEIEAMEKAMSSSKRANNKRAFQLVPRDMRRRTASHNIKRVPKRLRGRASREMKDDNTPTVTARRRKPSGHMRLRRETAKKLHNMAKKKDITPEILAKTPVSRATENVLRKPPRAASRFRKRQRHKTWLPTHVWHAKRARMVTRWRFAVSETPTEKSYRLTHRASGLRGCIAWDESYYSTVMIKGKEGSVKEVVRAVCYNSGDVLSKRVIMGTRASKTWAYKAGKYPACPIGPVEVVWCVPELGGESTEECVRKLFIRIHPSAFLELWGELLSVAKPLKVSVEDLRFEIGSIEITGPAATNALMTVLHPIDDGTGKDSPSGLWRRLKSLTNPSALPLGALLAFDMSDPRLRFPPRLPEDTRTQEEMSEDIFEVCSTWPADKTQVTSSLFSREARTAAVKLQSSQKKINKRKGEAAPGGYPALLPTDPKVPIILLASRRQSSPGGVSGAIGSWTILMPWKWVQPVWYGIMQSSSNVRFGGLNELHQVAYENAIGYFPDDFPGTSAGAAEEERKGGERKESWEKRPKGKRVEWESVRLGEKKGEIGNGFLCDWAWLVKGKVGAVGGTIESVEETTKATGNDQSQMDMDTPPPGQLPTPTESTLPPTNTVTPPPSPLQPPPWNVPPTIIKQILTNPNSPLPTPLTSLPPTTLSNAIFTVKITYTQRGTPLERARVYSLPKANKELKEKWRSLPTNKGRKWERTEEALEVPGEEDLIGFITTGNFNLKEGKGVGVGALGFEKVFGSAVGTDGVGNVGKVCIVRDVGSSVGRLARWEVV